APAARLVRLAGRADVLQMDVEHVLAELVDRTRSVVALRSPPAGVDRRPESAAACFDLRKHLVRSAFRMVFDADPHAVLPRDRADFHRVAGDTAADHRSAELPCELARADDVRRLDPDGIRRYAETVPGHRLARDRHVLVRRPPGAEVRAPDVHRVEAEGTD